MVTGNPQTEYALKMCILSHPDSLGVNILQQLIETKFDETPSHDDFSTLGVSISTIKLMINDKRVKLVLVRVNCEEFLDKIRPYYRGARVFFILFKKNEPTSFQNAQRLFQHLKKINHDKDISVVFTEIMEEDPEVSEDSDEEDIKETVDGIPVFYHDIQRDDVQGFRNILTRITKYQLDS